MPVKRHDFRVYSHVNDDVSVNLEASEAPFSDPISNGGESSNEDGLGANTSDDVAFEYDESRCYQTSVRCLGQCCWLFVGFVIVAWIVHWFAVASADPCFVEYVRADRADEEPNCSPEQLQAERERFELAPAFSKSLIWMSIAHHTEPWKEWWERSAPPPPPIFA